MTQMMKITIFLILTTILVGCAATVSDDDQLRGRVMVWYAGSEAEAAVFDDLFDRFSQIHPQVTVLRQNYPADNLIAAFQDRTIAGVGPDMLITHAANLPMLIDQQLVRPVDSDEFDLSTYRTEAVDMLRADDNLYGLPLALQTQGLYFNRNLVSEPPASLDGLMETATAGNQIAFPTNFYDAYWGVSAFGGRLFDEEGRVTLNRGSFANWLGWLQDAQEEPNIVMRNNTDSLRALFASEQVAYYIGSSADSQAFKAVLGDEAVGVAPLPEGPSVAAGPFMEVETLLFSQVSAPNDHEIAVRLARFLTNIEQQRRLAIELDKLPVNLRVRVNPRIAPTVSAFIRQSRTAVPIALNDYGKLNRLRQFGDETYIRVLEGELDIAEAGVSLSDEVNSFYGLETPQVETTTPAACTVEGALTVWHSWATEKAAALEQIRDQFVTDCPDVSVELRPFQGGQMVSEYQSVIEAAETDSVDLLLTRSSDSVNLINNDLALDITRVIETDFLQQYIPSVQQMAQVNGRLYSIPVLAQVTALYYNRNLVEPPPAVLDDLLAQVNPQQRIAFSYQAEDAFWGVSAFGEQQFDEQTQLTLNQTALTAWLTWLRDAQVQPAIVLVPAQDDAAGLFAQEEAAYFVGGSQRLARLQTQFDVASIGVSRLPSGPDGGVARPFLELEEFVINPNLEEAQINLALEFAQYTAGATAQLVLLESARQIPVNVNVAVDAEQYPAVSGFREQINSVTVPPYAPGLTAYREDGNILYRAVLEDEVEPAQAVTDFADLFEGGRE